MSVATMLLCYFTCLNLVKNKGVFLHFTRTNTAVNMTKVVIKILQGSAATQTV